MDEDEIECHDERVGVHVGIESERGSKKTTHEYHGQLKGIRL